MLYLSLHTRDKLFYVWAIHQKIMFFKILIVNKKLDMNFVKVDDVYLVKVDNPPKTRLTCLVVYFCHKNKSCPICGEKIRKFS